MHILDLSSDFHFILGLKVFFMYSQFNFETLILMNIGSSFRWTQPKYLIPSFQRKVVFQYIVDRNGLIKLMIIHTHMTIAK